ncbi:acyloxyacyl hydrolase [Fulvivirga lutea]|uniref:Acyloxyacyl hydrolase n=1 Tax=Fulvivirga lutea TaxID=2810512 RepID=A0A975A0Q6_9BACT|nr:acyloxyacyl hydrolase [Fulvivirga lutea]QSE97450.1 acyloxyacyl hydrolase [Fulvivirga lutea]
MRYCALIIVYCLSGSVYSQINIWESSLHYGKIIPHSSELKPVTEEPLWGLQLDYSRLKLSEKAWDQCNCYAKLGASFTYFNYQNPDQLGSSSNLIFFAEPYLSYKSPLKISMRTGVGFTYLNRLYDENTNPENLFFSSHLSFIMHLGLYGIYSLNDNYALKVGFNYNHISNGGLKQPNKGMNFPTISAGVIYNRSSYKLEAREKNTHLKKKLFYYARLFGTMPEVSNEDVSVNERKLLIGLSGGALFHVTQSNAFNVGVEFTNDESYKRSAELMGEDYDHRVVGLVLGHNFVFGKILFNQQMGWYAYRPFPSTSNSFYQRYELMYKIADKLQAGVGLKSHGHVAENMDLRIGVIF